MKMCIRDRLYQFLKNDRCKKRAYICSPLSAVTDEEMVENIKIARAYMYYAMKKMGMNASAPHAYLPMLLCDKVPADRSIALQFGLELLEESDVLLICGNRISSGTVSYTHLDVYKRQIPRSLFMNATLMQIASQNGHLCHIRRPPWNLNGGQPRTH